MGNYNMRAPRSRVGASEVATAVPRSDYATTEAWLAARRAYMNSANRRN